MSPQEIEKLLGGYATDTLTEEERSTLFAAALDNQALFDALADEQALRDLLQDLPAARSCWRRCARTPCRCPRGSRHGCGSHPCWRWRPPWLRAS